MNRRAFVSGRRGAEISCERLYMKYLDARGDGRLDEFVTALERELSTRRAIRFSGLEWLADDAFRQVVGPLIKTANTGTGA